MDFLGTSANKMFNKKAPEKAISPSLRVTSLVDRRLDAFYVSASVPPHMRNLLLLHGISEIEHLEYLDAESIVSLENSVRDGSLTDTYVDMSSKQDQRRYFGAVIVKRDTFKFRDIEKRIMQGLAAKAKEYLEKGTGRAGEQLRSQKNNKRSRHEALENQDSTLENNLGYSSSHRLEI